MTSTRTLFVFLAAGALAATWLKSWLEDEDEGPAPLVEVAPGYYMLDADMVALGEDGRPVYHLLAAELRQEGEELPTSLTEIRIEYDPRTGIEWILTAPRGQVTADLSTVRLEGGVVIASSGDGPATRMLSEDLTVLLDTHEASTEGPVRITQNGSEVEGVGLLANLMDQTVRLQSRVHGQYLP